MGKNKTKEELIEDITKERRKLEMLLTEIPPDIKEREPVVDGLTVKDILAHRTEWGRMMIGWYQTARAGDTPKVPSDKYKWNELKALNAEIKERYRASPLPEIERSFAKTHDELYDLILNTTEEELFGNRYYPFTGTSDLATYFTSATAGHYRSATRHIRKWWKGYRA